MKNKLKKFQEYIEKSNHIVFFGGAGVSTESGIPDFRSDDGLYNNADNEFNKYNPEYYLSYDCLTDNPEIFFRYIRTKLDTRKYKPNITHNMLAKMEAIGKLKAIVTQNIDGLHQKARSKNVIEIHGNIKNCYCENCKKQYGENYIFKNDNKIPKCDCGGYIRPQITLYGEELPKTALLKAILEISKADMLIIGGTSLSVFPAADLINYFQGKYMVVINKDLAEIKPPSDTLFIKSTLGKVFEELDRLI